MPKQTVPDIQFAKFVIAELPELFRRNKIKINYEYQRGDIWKSRQQIELITSINKRYLVSLFYNMTTTVLVVVTSKVGGAIVFYSVLDDRILPR